MVSIEGLRDQSNFLSISVFIFFLKFGNNDLCNQPPGRLYVGNRASNLAHRRPHITTGGSCHYPISDDISGAHRWSLLFLQWIRLEGPHLMQL
jgi:hypothetical protein